MRGEAARGRLQPPPSRAGTATASLPPSSLVSAGNRAGCRWAGLLSVPGRCGVSVLGQLARPGPLGEPCQRLPWLGLAVPPGSPEEGVDAVSGLGAQWASPLNDLNLTGLDLGVFFVCLVVFLNQVEIL